MLALKDFLETIDYRITEGSEYCWNSFGKNTHRIECTNLAKYTITCVFDTTQHFVYEMEAWDYTNNRTYRWLHPDFVKGYKKECKQHNVDFKNAFDDVNYIDLETSEDIISKSRAIIAGEDYDTRIEVPLTLEDDQLFELMKLAHARDLTLNQMVEEMLRSAINHHKTED